MQMVKAESCNVNAVQRLIQNYVPDCAVESNAGAELSFTLPNESSSRFEELFNTLDAQKGSLGISSWGASVTTMEEVFLKYVPVHCGHLELLLNVYKRRLL